MDSSISNLLGSINSLINTNNSGSDPRSTLDVHTKDFADYDSDSDSIGEGDLISTPTNTYILGRIFSPSPELSSYSNSIYKFTYRSGFSEMKPYGYTTDKGWGCMLRCCQMLVGGAVRWKVKGRVWEGGGGGFEEMVLREWSDWPGKVSDEERSDRCVGRRRNKSTSNSSLLLSHPISPHSQRCTIRRNSDFMKS